MLKKNMPPEVQEELGYEFSLGECGGKPFMSLTMDDWLDMLGQSMRSLALFHHAVERKDKSKISYYAVELMEVAVEMQREAHFWVDYDEKSGEKQAQIEGQKE